MSNAKTAYSSSSREYVNNTILQSELDKQRYYRSKTRETLYNENWLQQKVNLNELIEKYAPKAIPKDHGIKMEWKGPKFTVVADKANGSVRIKVNGTSLYLDKNENTTHDKETTHFKIKKWEEQ